ncbi:MAG: type II toxin-antitoxin system Phd/YefM family antitoxin [Promicromonosporaceae bacterium]|nr:type II toxin-antitoxin system Phd/YefM family antitoxin [Promicromonosporaceae bacterium]
MAWQVQEAKQRFSEVLRAAEHGAPQVVTRRGEEVAAVIDIETYRRLQRSRPNLVDYLFSKPGLLEDDESDELFARSPESNVDRVVFD